MADAPDLSSDGTPVEDLPDLSHLGTLVDTPKREKLLEQMSEARDEGPHQGQVGFPKALTPLPVLQSRPRPPGADEHSHAADRPAGCGRGGQTIRPHPSAGRH